MPKSNQVIDHSHPEVVKKIYAGLSQPDAIAVVKEQIAHDERLAADADDEVAAEKAKGKPVVAKPGSETPPAE